MFEDDLKHALSRTEPPAGFEQRVLARLNDGNAKKQPLRFAAWAAAAAMTCASFVGISIYRHNLQERKGMEARDQLVLALQITGKKLDAVRDTINNHGGNEQR